MYESSCYLLCVENDLEIIIDCFHGHYGVKPLEGSNVLNLRQGDIQLKISMFTRKLDNEYVNSQLEKISGYFRRVQTSKTDIKDNLLFKISSCNGFIPVRIICNDEKENERIQDDMREVMKRLDSLMIIKSGTVFIDANGQIIFTNKGESDLQSNVDVIEDIVQDDTYQISQEQLSRRSKNIELIKNFGIYTLPELPVIESEEECKLRRIDEIVCRMIALMAAAIYSECLYWEKMPVVEAREFIDTTLGKYGYKDYFSQKEREYFNNNDPMQREIINYSWQYENVYVLEWVLGLAESLYFPGSICDVAATVKTITNFDSVDEIVTHSRMRPKNEILDEADFIYRLDWSCVDARINNKGDLPGVISGVVSERHKTLNWLIMPADWDYVDTST